MLSGKALKFLYNKNRLLKSVVFFFIIFPLFSYAEIERSGGRILVYLYIPDVNPQDVNYVMDTLEIRKERGEWISLLEEPVAVRAAEIAGDQIQLTESFVEAGEYTEMRMRVSDATLKMDNNRYTLALPKPNGEVNIKLAVRIRNEDSVALFLIWNPDKSVINRFSFQPSIRFEKQKISSQTLLLYVANSGSNYLTVIDRFENRVVGVIGVGENPTGLVLSKEQGRLYVLNSGSNSISFIDTSQDYVVDRIHLISGIDPVEMAMIPHSNNVDHGKLYITNRGSNDVTVADTFLKAQVKSIRVGNAPMGITANPERAEVYVTNSESNSISIIDSLSDTVKATINVGTKPLGIVVVKDSIYVLNEGSDRITIIDLVSKKITGTLLVRGPRMGIYSKQYDKVYLSNYSTGQVSFLIPTSAVITRSISVGRQPIGVAIDENRNRLYVVNSGSNTVTVINTVSEVVEKTITVGEKPYGIVSISEFR